MDRTEDTPINVSLHVLPFEEGCLIYDARSFSIVRDTKPFGEVAGLVATKPLIEIIEQLQDQIEPEEIIRIYLTIRELVRAGVLASTEPKAPPLPGLRSLTLLLAGGCNMGCAYCFEADKPSYQQLNLLSIERADEILLWFVRNHQHDHMHLQLYGGEPLLNWPVLTHVVDKFIELAKSNGKTHGMYIITNGTLLSEERCEFLISRGVEIQISLDGDSSANRHRVLKGGRETFGKVSRWIDYLVKRDANFNVRAVLTPTNPDPEVTITSLERLGADKATYGVVSTDKAQLRFRGEDLTQLEHRQHNHIEYRMDKYKQTADAQVVPANVRAIARRIDLGVPIHFHCNAGVTEVTVTHTGELYECQRLMGSPAATVDTIDWYEKVSSFLTPANQKAKCATCFARYNCGGGCKEANVLNTGEDHAWPEYCNVKRKEVEAAIVFSYMQSRVINPSIKEQCNESQ